MAHSYGPIVLPTHCHARPLSVLSSVSLQCGWLRSTTTTTTISPHSPSRPQRVCACVFVKVVHTELDRVFASPLSVRPGPPTVPWGCRLTPSLPDPPSPQPLLTCHPRPPPPPAPVTACRRWPGMVWDVEYPWAKLDCKTPLPASTTLKTHDPPNHPPTLPH